MITTRTKGFTSCASFCNIVLPRTESRQAEGELRPHTVYLVRIESHLGKYPSADTWFELRYTRFQQLHAALLRAVKTGDAAAVEARLDEAAATASAGARAAGAEARRAALALGHGAAARAWAEARWWPVDFPQSTC